MKRFHLNSKGFTMVEMIVVIAILAFVAAAVILDYGKAVQKARLDVAVEQLISVTETARVQGRTQCSGVAFSQGQAPALLLFDYDVDLGACDFSSENRTVLKDWPVEIDMEQLQAVEENLSGDEVAVEGDAFFVLFAPPDSNLQLYLGTPSSSNRLPRGISLQMGLTYGGDRSDSLSKTVDFNLLTGNFVVSSGYTL